MRAVLEEGIFGARNAAHQCLRNRRRAGVVPPGRDEGRKADLAEAVADVPAGQHPVDCLLVRPHITP